MRLSICLPGARPIKASQRQRSATTDPITAEQEWGQTSCCSLYNGVMNLELEPASGITSVYSRHKVWVYWTFTNKKLNHLRTARRCVSGEPHSNSPFFSPLNSCLAGAAARTPAEFSWDFFFSAVSHSLRLPVSTQTPPCTCTVLTTDACCSEAVDFLCVHLLMNPLSCFLLSSS